MLDTVPTDTALNIFLNGLHDCHDFHCFIMNLLQRVMQKLKNVLLPPKIPHQIPPKMIIQITNLKRHRCRITHIIANKKHPPATTYPFIIQSPFLHKKRAFRL